MRGTTSTTFQFTLPRGERRLSSARYAWLRCVSIHAPARGATEERLQIDELVTVSIHAPARGATTLSFSSGSLGRFQFTLPRGERRGNSRHHRACEGVSIHAPARGATPAHQRAGAPRGGFNSRSREGSDQDLHIWGGRRGVSIHAPARGATSLTATPIVTRCVSIHAPARGATSLEMVMDISRRSFNSRSREGSDVMVTTQVAISRTFQFTLPRGERRHNKR